MGPMELSPTSLLMILSAPSLMIVVTFFERRWGPLVAGMVAAAPVAAMIGLLIVSVDLGAAAGREMGLRMAGYIPAQVAFGLAGALLVARLGALPSLSAGVVSYLLVTGLASVVPVWVAVCVSVVVLAAAIKLVPDPEASGGSRMPSGWPTFALRAGVALLAVLALTLAAHRFGPTVAGAIGAFPAFTATLALFVHAHAGALGVRSTLIGMVRGLTAYLAFVLAFGLAVTHAGAAMACAVGVVASACCYLTPLLVADR